MKQFVFFIFIILFTSCNSNEDVTINSKDVKKVELQELYCDKEAVKNAFNEHFCLSRTSEEDITNIYDFSNIRNIKLVGHTNFYLVPSKKDSVDFLMGIPHEGEIPYIFKVKQISKDSFAILNELDEIVATNKYVIEDEIFVLSSDGENDAVTVSSRKSVSGLLCSLGIEAVCYYSCQFAGITGGWSLVVGCCGAAAAYFVCP